VSEEALTGRRFSAYAGFSLLIWLSVAAVCLCVGPGELLRLHGDTIGVRASRVLTASLVGAALAAAGVTFQALLRNPLASPYILGVSSGATVGVMLSAFLLTAPWSKGLAVTRLPQNVYALAFALVTMAAVYLLSRRHGQLEPLTLLLVGVMVTAFNGAIVMVLNLLVPYGVRADFVVWIMGLVSEDVSGWELGWTAAGVAVGWAVMLAMSHQFNVQMLGEQTATTLGVRMDRLRLLGFLAASIVTALAVSVSGPIGFVGLICPHICRRLFGPDHRVLMLTATTMGAAFLVSADTLVRALANWTHGEMPVGVVTALCGGPFFIYLLRRQLARGGQSPQ